MWQQNKAKQPKYHQKNNSRYASKNYDNPYFQRKKGPSLIKWPAISIPGRIKIYLLSALLVLAAGLALAYFSGFFIIERVEIIGANRISEELPRQVALEQAKNSRWLIFSQENIFFYNTRELADRLSAKYALDDLKVRKKWPRTIQISYVEKSYALIWQEDDRYFYADNTGYILEEANLLEIGERDYPIVRNDSGVKTLGKRIEAETPYIAKVLELFSLARSVDNFQIERFIKDSDAASLKLKLANGPELYLDALSDITPQLDRIILIRDEKLKEDFYKKEYIDVRYGNSVYYR